MTFLKNISLFSIKHKPSDSVSLQKQTFQVHIWPRSWLTWAMHRQNSTVVCLSSCFRSVTFGPKGGRMYSNNVFKYTIRNYICLKNKSWWNVALVGMPGEPQLTNEILFWNNKARPLCQILYSHLNSNNVKVCRLRFQSCKNWFFWPLGARTNRAVSTTVTFYKVQVYWFLTAATRANGWRSKCVLFLIKQHYDSF